ncbi:hypothetical protein VPH35_115135 [Triticum aestivum]
MMADKEHVGVPQGSGMFRIALEAVAFLSEEKISDKVDYLKKSFRWSDGECSSVRRMENVYVEKYICPHKEAALHLAEDNVAACGTLLKTLWQLAEGPYTLSCEV